MYVFLCSIWNIDVFDEELSFTSISADNERK